VITAVIIVFLYFIYEINFIASNCAIDIKKIKI
jgi:hypothetical protein